MARKHRDAGVTPKIDRLPGRSEALPLRSKFSIDEGLVWIVLAVLLAFSLALLVYPVTRAFYRLAINYNEGWNVYTTQAAMQHRPMYYPKYGWTTVNYPLLSFYVIGFASHFIGDYLLTGRLLSVVGLLLSCFFVMLIVRKLTDAWGPAIFAGALCLGTFCLQAIDYVAMDDPQMLAHSFFLFGLWLSLEPLPSTKRIAGITSVFAAGGNIKQNLLPAPLSVFFDLLLTSRKKAGSFAVFGAILVALTIGINMWLGGPYFISHLLTPRAFSVSRLRTQFFTFYVPLGLPLALSIFWSIWQLKKPPGRVISFYFFSSLLIGIFFSGGEGVSDNAFFDNIFAMSIIMGAGLDLLWKAPIPVLGKGGRCRFLVPVLLYSSVFLFFGLWGVRTLGLFPSLQEREKTFEAEVSFLIRQPGPAICETLILCYDAGKPYILDPFNSGRLVRLGKLNSNEIVSQIAERKFGAIQTENPVTKKPSERFPDDVLDAIAQYYVEELRAPDCHIYVPRPEPGAAPSPQ